MWTIGIKDEIDKNDIKWIFIDNDNFLWFLQDPSISPLNYKVMWNQYKMDLDDLKFENF